MSNFLSEPSTSNKQSGQQTILVAGRYALIERYSQSSLCDCYLAEDRRTLDAVGDASHVLLLLVNTHFNELAEFDHSLQRVLSEFTGHNNIEPVVTDSGITESGQHWYATPKYTGALLSHSIKQVGRHGLPVNDTLAIAERLLHAIKHSPLKDTYGYLEPEALYVSDDNVLLLSAPIAITLKLLTVGNRANKGKLTLHSSFISPEVAMGNPPVSTDDTFSFACIIYQMLNGHLPFVMDSSIEAALKQTEPAAVAKLSSQHWPVLQQGMAFVREQRQSDPDELLFQLNEPVKKPRKFNAKSWGAIAATLLLGATALYAAMQMQQTPQQAPQDTVVAQAPSPEPEGNKTSKDHLSSSSSKPTSANEKTSTDNSASSSSSSTPVADKQTDTTTPLNLATTEASSHPPTVAHSEEPAKTAPPSPQTTEAVSASPAPQRNQTNNQIENDLPNDQADYRGVIIQAQASNDARPRNLQQEEESQRLMQSQQQRDWEAEQQRLAEEQRRQAAAEEARRLAEQKRLEEATERQRLLRLQEQREWEAEQQRRAEEARRLAEQKKRAKEEERLRLQRQRKWEAEQKRLAALKQQQSKSQPTQTEQLAKQPAAYSPRLIKTSQKLRFPDPSAFGPIDTSKQEQANSVCRSIGALSAIGYHPRALKIDGTPYQGGAYYCHFPDAPANEARLIASRPSSGRPQVIDKAKPAWDRPSAFGSVPSTLQGKGNRICRQAGFTRAVGYHPKTFDEQGELMPDGGYLCE